MSHPVTSTPLERVPEALPHARRVSLRRLGRKLLTRDFLLGVCSFLILLGLWGLVVSLPTLRKIPGPVSMFQALLTLDPGLYVRAATRSFLRVLAGYLIAAGVGIPLGIGIGYWKVFRDLTFPAIELLRPIPPIAWIPLSILFFVNIESQIVFLTFYGAFFPIVYNTIGGVSGVDRNHVRAARSLGANDRQVFRYIILPGSLPSIFTGLTIAMGITWLMVIAAEIMATRGGLGYLTWEAYVTLNYPLIFVGMGAIGIVGSLSSLMVRLVGNRVMRWRTRT